jgi:hypothetical protein
LTGVDGFAVSDTHRRLSFASALVVKFFIYVEGDDA